MVSTAPSIPDPRRFSVRLPSAAWIGLATVLVTGVFVGLRISVPIYRHHAAMREIECLGGKAKFRTVHRGPKWLRERVGYDRMARFEPVVGLGLRGTQVTDATLRQISCLTSMQRLGLVNTSVTDAGLVHLKGLARLEILHLATNSP